MVGENQQRFGTAAQRDSEDVPRDEDLPPPRRYDAGKDGFIDLMELKLMMEKLGAPQTHLGLKNMIKEVDEDLDSKLSFREVSAWVGLWLCPRGRRWMAHPQW